MTHSGPLITAAYLRNSINLFKYKRCPRDSSVLQNPRMLGLLQMSPVPTPRIMAEEGEYNWKDFIERDSVAVLPVDNCILELVTS